jgi:hypothetical protein
MPRPKKTVYEVQQKDPFAINGVLYAVGDRYVSDTGHEVVVIATGGDEITFGFIRMKEGEPEKRERTVPLKRVVYFLKAYHRM